MGTKREYRDWSKNELVREVERLRAILYEHAADNGASNPSVGGELVDVVGNPNERGGVIFDMRGAVLLQHIDVAIVDEVSKGRPIPDNPVLTMMLEGRVNKTQDRAKTLYIFDVDGAAAIVSELTELASRIGPAFVQRLKERLEAIKAGR